MGDQVIGDVVFILDERAREELAPMFEECEAFDEAIAELALRRKQRHDQAWDAIREKVGPDVSEKLKNRNASYRVSTGELMDGGPSKVRFNTIK